MFDYGALLLNVLRADSLVSVARGGVETKSIVGLLTDSGQRDASLGSFTAGEVVQPSSPTCRLNSFLVTFDQIQSIAKLVRILTDHVTIPRL